MNLTDFDSLINSLQSKKYNLIRIK